MSDIAALLTWTNIRFLLEGLGLTLHHLGAGHRLLYRARRRHLHHARDRSSRLLRGFAIAYVELFKNTPLLLWIMFTFFVAQLPPLPRGGARLHAVHQRPRVAEIVRGGLASVPAGQYEAARSQGFSAPCRCTCYIILPQALRNMVPALLSQFVTTIKDTSLPVGRHGAAGAHGPRHDSHEQLQLHGADLRHLRASWRLIYFVVCFTLSQIVRAYQRRLKGAQ